MRTYLGGGVGVEMWDESLQSVEAVLDVVSTLLFGVQVCASRLARRAGARRPGGGRGRK